MRAQEAKAIKLLDLALNAHDRAIYESSIGYVAPSEDPA